jgi:hypothetical protein
MEKWLDIAAAVLAVTAAVFLVFVCLCKVAADGELLGSCA